MGETKVPEQVWEMMKLQLGYSDEELELFKKDPKNAKILSRAAELGDKTVVFEVVHSEGCNSQHKVGTKFFFSSDGNLLTKMSPSKVCAYLLPAMSQTMFAMQELGLAGVDPNELCFNRKSCVDVGILCGGWGRVVIEAKVMDMAEAKKLQASE